MESTEPTPDCFKLLTELLRPVHKALVGILERIEAFSASPWMTLRGASTYSKISVTQLRRLIKSGKIPAFTANPDGQKGKLLISRHDLDKFIVHGRCGRLTPEQKRYLQDRISDD